MSRLRLLLLVAGAGLPVLIVAVFSLPPSSGAALGVVAGVWTIAVWMLAEILWRRTVQPLTTVLAELGVDDVSHLLRAVHEAQREADNCRQERQALNRLIDDISSGLGEGLLVVDADLNIRLCNPRARGFLGATSIELGESLLDLERDPTVLGAIRLAVGGTTPRRRLVENPRGVWEVRPFPLSQAGAVVLVTEVGPLRRAAELRRRFVQDLSHELRSPLAVMRTTVEALEDQVSPDIAHMLIRQVERITLLTDELYELASIEAGTLKIDPVVQSVNPVIRQVASDFTGVAQQSEVEIRPVLDEDLSFEFDRRALARVLSNLVDNAVKYNRAGGWVRISTADLGDSAQLIVEDSGLGIPAAELGAVMQRFYRVDRARTAGSGGLGLGLAIVKHMVQLMGGELTLDSREDVGTRVTISFPKTSRS